MRVALGQGCRSEQIRFSFPSLPSCLQYKFRLYSSSANYTEIVWISWEQVLSLSWTIMPLTLTVPDTESVLQKYLLLPKLCNKWMTLSPKYLLDSFPSALVLSLFVIFPMNFNSHFQLVPLCPPQNPQDWADSVFINTSSLWAVFFLPFLSLSTW